MSRHLPYHIGARCINREWFQIPMETVWSIYSDYLFLMQKMFDVRIHSFVLMSNHFHLLISTPSHDLSRVMNYFMRETSRVLGFESNRINQVYGGPYHGSIITTERHFLHAYKYVYRNPVEAKMVGRVEDYPFSNLAGCLGASRLFIPVIEDALLFDNTSWCIDWLNTPFRENHHELIKKALRRKEFLLAKNRKNNKPSELESILV